MALTLRSLIPTAWRPKPRFEDNTPIGQPIQGLIQSYVSPWAETGIQITPQNARESPTVFACVRLISNSIARMEWRVMVNDEDGSPRPMPKHPLWRILNDEPNAYMSGFTFRESMLTDCLLFGNAYAFIERDASARPVALQKLRPDLVFVSRGPDNAPIYHYQSGTNGGARVLHGFDVFHLSGAGSDGLLGDPPIYLAREVIGLEIVTTRFVSRFFLNGGRPAGALTTPGTLSPEALDRLRQSWQQLHSGADNAGRVAILEAGMKFEKMAIDPDEAQLLELRSYCREQISAAFGVPPHMVGDTGKQSYASAEQADMEYVKHCLGAWASRLEREVARKLIVNESGTSTRISFDELLRGDLSARFSSYNTALQAGFLSINEVRAREGLPPVDGGDQIRVPLNQQTLDPDANVPGSEVEPATPGADEKKPEAEPKPESEETPKADAGDTAPAPLNGAQIQAAQQILLAVTAKQLAGPAAEALLVAVGMSPAMAKTMVSSQLTVNPSKIEPVPEATRPATEADAEPDQGGELEDNSAGAVRLARRNQTSDSPEKYSGINFKPTEAMANAAARGLKLRAEFNRGGTEVGVARATQLKNRETLSPSTVRRMASYFARHAVDKRPGWDSASDPSAGFIAWLLWGGDPGRDWSEGIVERMDKADDDEDRGGNVSTEDRDCGTGAGGFQPGNDCGHEDGDGKSDKAKTGDGQKKGSAEFAGVDVEHEVTGAWDFFMGDHKHMNYSAGHSESPAPVAMRPPVTVGKPPKDTKYSILQYMGPGANKSNPKFVVKIQTKDFDKVAIGGGSKDKPQLLTMDEAIKLYDHKVKAASDEPKPEPKPTPKTPAEPADSTPKEKPPKEKPKRKPVWLGQNHYLPDSTDKEEFDSLVDKFAADGEFKGFTHLTKAQFSRFRGKIHPADPHAIRVAEKLAERPEHHIAGLGRTVTGKAGKYLRGSSKRGNVLGLYGLGSKKIEVHAAYKVGQRQHAGGLEEGTFEHEVGHHVHMRMTPAAHDEWEAISKNGDTAKISAYARTCTGEHFAEAYRAWHMNAATRRQLRELEPEAAAFMERLDDAKSPHFLPGEETGDYKEAVRRYGTPRKR